MNTQVGYSGTPLPKKLGIAPGRRVLLVAAPDGFALESLPDGVEVDREGGGAAGAGGAGGGGAGGEPYDVVLAFCPDLASLTDRFGRLAGRIPPDGALWISWPGGRQGGRGGRHLVRAEVRLPARRPAALNRHHRRTGRPQAEVR